MEMPMLSLMSLASLLMRLKKLPGFYSRALFRPWCFSSLPIPVIVCGSQEIRSPTLMIMLISSAKASRIEHDKQDFPILDTIALLPT